MKRRRRRRRAVSVPLASMGDIAFLLIIFFMLLSDFAKDKDFPITLPQSAHVQKTKAQIAARVAIDKQGVIYFNGERVQTPEAVEWGVHAALAKTLTDDQRHVKFKCDAAISKKKYEPVLKAIANGGGIIEAVGKLP